MCWTPSAIERVELELLLGDVVGVVLHVLDPASGTPSRSFFSRSCLRASEEADTACSSEAPCEDAAYELEEAAARAAVSVGGGSGGGGAACQLTDVPVEQQASAVNTGQQAEAMPGPEIVAQPRDTAKQTGSDSGAPGDSSSSGGLLSSRQPAPGCSGQPAEKGMGAAEAQPVPSRLAAPEQFAGPAAVPPAAAREDMPAMLPAPKAGALPACPASAERQAASLQQPVVPPAADGPASVGDHAAVADTAVAAATEQPTGEGSVPTLASLMGMLQQLLVATKQQQAQHPSEVPAAAAPALPVPPPPTADAAVHGIAPAAGSGGSGGSCTAFPGGVEKLLALELEVVQLQQSLQIAQLEFETRTVQLHSLKQRADDAEQRAEVAEERAASLSQQVQQLERQAGELRGQLGEAAAKQQQEGAHLAARLAAASAKQQAAEQEAARLRQQLAAVRQSAETEQAQLRRTVAAEQVERTEQEAVLRQENRQLRSQVASACAALKAMGILPQTVFGSHPADSAPSGTAGSVPSLPESPASAAPLLTLPISSERRQMPPQVPRLQLSSITLQQLQAQASPKPPLCPSSSLRGAVAAAAAAASGEQIVGQVPPATGTGSDMHQRLPRQQEKGSEQEQGEQQRQQRQQQEQEQAADDMFAHVMVAADGTAALPANGNLQAGTCRGAPATCAPAAAARMGLADAAASPASSVQQNCDLNLPPLLTARHSMSAAQQELLATARQWQQTARSAAAAAQEEEEDGGTIRAYYPPPLPSARASARGPAPAPVWAAAAPGGAAAAAARPAVCGTQQRPYMPLPRAAGAPGPAIGGAPFPGTLGRKVVLQRRTYGQDPSFHEVKEAYNAVMSSEVDRSSKWARSVFSSASAVDADPARVDHMVQSLLQLFAANGVHVPLLKCGPCQYRLGSAKLALRLVNGRLMARAGAGQTVDVFTWLEKQQVQQQHVPH